MQGSSAGGDDSQAHAPAGGFETADVKPAFLKRLAELVDLKAIAKSGIKVVYDPFWGAGRGYSSELLREAGVAVETVHDYRDVLFGGHAPEPDDHLLGDAKTKMKEIGAALGIATDGDADRFGIVDARWHVYSAELHYCAAVRLPGGDARLAKRRGQERGNDQPDQRCWPSTTRSRFMRRRWGSSILAS